jgi:hypothetical protein
VTSGALHVVVSCKSRKTVDIPTRLRMSGVRSVALNDRVRDWVDRLESFPAKRIPASRLYAGDHWKVVLRIPEASAGQLEVKLWVVSAGYGLVASDTPLKPYSATFIRSHADAIAPAGSEYSARDWWRELSEWKPEGHSQPRTLAKLAADLASDRDVLLLALSEPYAQALRHDIGEAERNAPGRVALVSVGLASAGDISAPQSLLPVEARLKQSVGGAMQGVNGRIAERIVREHGAWFPRVERLRGLVRDWVEVAPALPRYDRAEQTDDDVREFIRECARLGVATSKSAALRALRDSGRACEQGRFGRLYREVSVSPAALAVPQLDSPAGDAA